MNSLWDEIKRRHVGRVTIAYAVVGWLLVQVADFATETFGAPPWVLQIFSVFVLLGLPVAILLAWAFDIVPNESQDGDAATAPRSRSRMLFAAFLLVAVAIAAWLQFFAPAPVVRNSTGNTTPNTAAQSAGTDLLHLDLTFPEDAPLALIGAAELGSGRQAFTISPNGRYLVYVGAADGVYELYLRDLYEDATTHLSGTAGAFSPFFAPNNAWIGFFVGNELFKVHISGSEPVFVAEATNSVGASWASGDQIVMALEEGDRIVKVSASGSTVEDITSYPDSNWMFPFAIRGQEKAISDGRLINLATGDSSALPLRAGHDTRYANGYLFYESSGSLLAARFDLSGNMLKSNAIPVITGLRSEIWGAAQWSVSDNGILAYMPGGPAGGNPMYWVGPAEPTAIDLPVRIRGSFEVSPDGQYLAVLEYNGTGGDIWVYALADGRSTKLTTDGLNRHAIFWSPDSSSVYYQKNEGSFTTTYRSFLNSQHPAERVLPKEREGARAQSISADGNLLGVHGPDGVAVYDLKSERWDSIPTASKNDWGTAISPDGRAILYTSSSTGGYQTFLQPLPPTGKRYQISRVNGAEEPRWSADGSKAYYRSGNRIMSVDISLDPEVQIGEPQIFFSGVFENVGGRSYAIHPDGERALVIRSENLASSIRVVSNWFAKVEQLIQESEAKAQ